MGQRAQPSKLRTRYEHKEEFKDQESRDEQYDSTDSLDQLLDETFIPKHLKAVHNRQAKKTPPKKSNIRSTAGGRRAKAMAMMAHKKGAQRRGTTNSSFGDRQQIHESNRKQFRSIRKDLVTPAIRKQHPKTSCATLMRSRKVLDAAPDSRRSPSPPRMSQFSMDNLCVTPKRINAFRAQQTPCTPSPSKLLNSLNLNTPGSSGRTRKNLTLRFDLKDGGPEKYEMKEEEEPSVAVPNLMGSWKDIEYSSQGVRKPQQSGPPLKGKCKVGETEFGRLLKATRSLPLPHKWDVLIQKFNALESTLALYMRKNKFFVHYSNIVSSVQQVCQKRFSQIELQEILSIVPDFYHVQWTASVDKLTQRKSLKLTLTAMNYDPFTDEQIETPFNSERKEEDEDGEKQKERMNKIGVRFLKVLKLKERERVFRVRLVQYVAFHHQQFLVDNVLVDFDPLVTGKWHRRFDLENIKDIELSPLPLKPAKGGDAIEGLIQEQNQKLQEIADKELEKARQQREGEQQQHEEEVIPKHLAHLSPTFIAKIRAKRHAKKLVTTSTLALDENKNEHQFRLEQLPYLITLVRGIYIGLRKGSMSCDDLVALVKKRHRNVHILSAEIWQQLQILADFKSKFFNIKQGPMVKVAKMNKRIPTKEVLQEIQKHIKKLQV